MRKLFIAFSYDSSSNNVCHQSKVKDKSTCNNLPKKIQFRSSLSMLQSEKFFYINSKEKEWELKSKICLEKFVKIFT